MNKSTLYALALGLGTLKQRFLGCRWPLDSSHYLDVDKFLWPLLRDHSHKTDNRPLNFDEFENLINQAIYVSATPADYELNKTEGIVVEQIIRPTGLLDPIIEVKPSANQIDDLLEQKKITSDAVLTHDGNQERTSSAIDAPKISIFQLLRSILVPNSWWRSQIVAWLRTIDASIN